MLGQTQGPFSSIVCSQLWLLVKAGFKGSAGYRWPLILATATNWKATGLTCRRCCMEITAASSKRPEAEEGQRHQHGICMEWAVGQPGNSLACAVYTVLRNTENNSC